MTTVDQLMSLAPTRTDALSGAIRIFVMLQIICAVIVTPITSNAQVLGNDAEALVVLWSRAPMGLALTTGLGCAVGQLQGDEEAALIFLGQETGRGTE